MRYVKRVRLQRLPCPMAKAMRPEVQLFKARCCFEASRSGIHSFPTSPGSICARSLLLVLAKVPESATPHKGGLPFPFKPLAKMLDPLPPPPVSTGWEPTAGVKNTDSPCVILGNIRDTKIPKQQTDTNKPQQLKARPVHSRWPGTGQFQTGTGTVTLSGDTTVSSGKTLTVATYTNAPWRQAVANLFFWAFWALRDWIHWICAHQHCCWAQERLSPPLVNLFAISSCASIRVEQAGVRSTPPLESQQTSQRETPLVLAECWPLGLRHVTPRI